MPASAAAPLARSTSSPPFMLAPRCSSAVSGRTASPSLPPSWCGPAFAALRLSSTAPSLTVTSRVAWLRQISRFTLVPGVTAAICTGSSPDALSGVAVELQDPSPGFDPGVPRRPALLHARHQRPFRLRQAERIRQPLGDGLDHHAELAARDVGRGRQLLAHLHGA